MIKKRCPLLLVLLLLLATSCSDDDPASPPCPWGFGTGPALSPEGTYVLVANSLGETWAAIEAGPDSLIALPGAGLTGEAPNDLEVVGRRLYVVNSLANSVSEVDLTTGSTIACIDVGTGSSPFELEIDPADSTRAWLTTFLTGELIELDLAGRRVVRRTTVAPTLQGLWVGADRVAVTITAFNTTTFTYGTGEVVVYRKSDLGELARLDVPTNPQFVLRGSDQRVHVVCTGDFGTTSSGRIVRLEEDLSSVRDTLDLGGSPGRAELTADGKVYLSTFCNGVLAYDSGTFTALRDDTDPFLPGTCVGDVAVLGNLLLAADFNLDAVVALDPASGTVLQTLPAGDGPSALETAIP